MVFNTFLVLLGASMKICWAHLFYMGHFLRAVVSSSSWKFGPSVDPAAGRLLSENVSWWLKLAQKAFLRATYNTRRAIRRYLLADIECTFGLRGASLVQFTTNAGLYVKSNRN